MHAADAMRDAIPERAGGARTRALRRRVVDSCARGLCLGLTLVALLPLAAVLLWVAGQGVSGLSTELFTGLPGGVGEAGTGMGNAFLGTLQLTALACLLGIPPGILAGVYLAEYGRGKLASAVRFGADVLAGVPSIAVGIFVYTLVVLSMRRFSMLAGGVALAVLMLPTVTRTTEELLRLVPDSLREAALALGVPRWKAIVRVVLPAAASGIATGLLLAVARVAGETAPLLFTAFNNRFWSFALDRPVASVPVQIYTYAVSPFEEWHAQARAAALVLVAVVLVLNAGARLLLWRGRAR